MPTPRESPATRKPWYKYLGPGLITGAADDDPSGIATYSQAGAQFGLSMLWIMLFTLPLMAVVQIISAHIGRVSGQELSTNMRQYFPRRIIYGIVVLILISNVISIAADLSAMGDSLNLLIPGPAHYYAAGFGVISLLLEIFIPYSRYVNVLKWLTLALLAYVATVFVLNVPWRSVVVATFLPHVEFSADYFLTLIAVLGTTISPYLFFWQAAQEVEEEEIDPDAKPLKAAPEQAPAHFTRIKVDTYIGMSFSNIVGFFIILATAVTFHAHHIHDIQSSAQAASALKPIAGNAAFLFFAIGVIGTGFLGVPVLAGSAAYAIAGAFKWNKGLEHKPREAKEFYAVITISTLIGIAIGFTPINPIKALYWSAVINGVVAMPVMAALMLIAVRPQVMGIFVISQSMRILGWIATIAMGCATLAMAWLSLW
jgi:NRAMP (natural resistance-associated macrophage protein)-like metal ion transporter